MLYLYFKNSYYVLCNPDTFSVGDWHFNVTECITDFFHLTTSFPNHSVFGSHKGTLIAAYPSYNSLADFQANHPELFI